MAKSAESDVIVRAYDLGGFGDIAGATRLASFLNIIGLDTKIKATSSSALEKLKLLRPDVTFGNGEIKDNNALQVDIAGHYRDRRNGPNYDVPHHYTEDMDNLNDRRLEVPLYLKSGLMEQAQGIPKSFNLGPHAPMFYRPFREWDLPQSGKRDAVGEIIEALSNNGTLAKLGKKGIIEYVNLLDSHNRIGFAHLSPEIQSQDPRVILEHPYFHAIHTAHVNNNGQRFAVGMFVGKDLETKLCETALLNYWNAVDSNGRVISSNPDLPTLLFLGPQPQVTTTSLFLSSDIPTLVTGDLSLSDALYGLIAMKGPAFFYEAPSWKTPTLLELMKILNKRNPALPIIQFVGGNFNNNHIKIIAPQEIIDQGFSEVVNIFGNKNNARDYAELMRQAIRDEIQRRFGDVQVVGEQKNGLYIRPGAPYLLQDATAMIVETLRENPDALAETEKARKMLKDGVPVSINVQTGVLESQPIKPSYPLYDNNDCFNFLKKYGDSPLEMIIGHIKEYNYNPSIIKKSYLIDKVNGYSYLPVIKESINFNI